MRVSWIQWLGFAYALMFVGVVVIDFVPGLKDAEGYLFGIFALDLYDHSLHAFSGAWAALAAWHSTRQALWYFKIFGVVYFLDGFVGLFFGNAFLDFGLLQYGAAEYGIAYNIFANVPHILIGGGAAFIGFILGKKRAFTRRGSPIAPAEHA